MAKDEMPGTTPKAWIQEGKKDLDLLVEYGPEQYQSRNATGRRTGGCTCNGTIQFLKISAARLRRRFVATKPHLACGFSSQGRGVTIKQVNQQTKQQVNKPTLSLRNKEKSHLLFCVSSK